VDAGYSNDDAPILREFARFYPNLLQTKKNLNQAVQEVDILLLRGFYRWLLDFKYVLRAHPFKVTPELSLSHVKFREQLRDDFQKADPDFASYLRALSPTNPEYARLQKGLQHYKRLRDEGEIDKINIRWNLKKGQKGDRVKLLCRRLILEGYLAAEHDTSRFNNNVLEAVKLYQRKHQLRVSGRTDASTRGSINVSMSKRVKQIELGLLRWRESAINIDTPSYYFRVNIPQFELEVWDNNERIRVHRIVVGNRNEETSIERRQRGHFNHTPLLEKKVTTVVLNPLWFPPPRLQKELLEDMVREPDFFEKNNYGIKMKDDGSEIIFQKAGPDNALGLVKFLFPNEHHVYLHDTPAKPLFDRPIRSYSHGCMRLDQPLDLARHVLKRFNAMDEDDIEKILEKAKEHYIKLKTPIPIYVEYNSVGADEEGWVHFYIDIYKYDLAYWENRLPVELAEDLTSTEIKRLRQSSETTDAALDDLEDGGDDGVVPGP
jgi:murein L,D-transpeptidase YcbB/YkuD